MMPSIEIDNDVFAKLQARAEPFVDKPNDVIRRLLAEVEAAANAGTPAEPARSVTVEVDVHKVGRLQPLIQAGLVKPGDKVRHVRKRSNEVCEATITEGGCLMVEGAPELFREPSPALRHFTGSQIDGWANWLHVDSGMSLRHLRTKAGQS